MDQVKRMRLIRRQQLEDVPKLIQRIQLALPSKDAAQTCILSKSWLRAWSTSPAIRFCPSVDSLIIKKHQGKYMSWIRRTLLRYNRDNLPITHLDLQLGIHTIDCAAKKLITQATSSNGALKELHLAILAQSLFTFPDEIFSSENLNTLSLEHIHLQDWKKSSLDISLNPEIHCTNLRVLELVDVYISQVVLHKLLSTCKLLEKIILVLPNELNKIKVNNLRYLQELRIYPSKCNAILEVDDVPSLRSLVYDATWLLWDNGPALFKMCTIGSLRELYLDNVYMDDAFSNMIKSNFPFLERLTLTIKWCNLEIVDIRSSTLRRFRLDFLLNEEIKVQVYAPNLLIYEHASYAMPSLLFTPIPPEQIVLTLGLEIPIDELFFLKMREALNLSSKFNIDIIGSRHGVLEPFNIDDVRTTVPFPATNVEELFFRSSLNKVFWENSLPIFDTVFSICHPMYVKADYELWLKVANYFLKLIIKGVMEMCEIRNPLDERWVTLTRSSLSLLDRTTPSGGSEYEFKLSWGSP